MSRIFLGIDPGITGAVAGISSSGKFLFVFDIPTIEKETKTKAKTKARVKRKVNGAELYRQILDSINHEYENCFLMLESQSAMPPAKKDKNNPNEEQRSMGSASLMSLGDTFGSIRTVVEIAGIQFEEVSSRKWKNYYKIPGEKGGGKKVALSVARMLFRNAPLKLQKHHNRAEALLLARYAFDTHVEDN